MKQLTIEEQMYYAKDAAGILQQNGSEQHANAILQLLDTVKRLREEASELSWRTNPDRSGGQFTQSEIKGW